LGAQAKFNEVKVVKTVTEEMINAAIMAEHDYKVGEKTTIVVLFLRNGFEVVGTSACVNPAGYDHETGKKYARERAITKVWELEGYRLQQSMLDQSACVSTQ
jgi:hypothetical protein